MNEIDYNQESAMLDAKPLESLRLWLLRGRELRADLLERQGVLQDELAQIESALRALTFEDAPEEGRRNVLNMTDAGILRFVTANPKTSATALHKALGATTSARKQRILVSLRDMTKRGVLKREGTRGSYRYMVAPT
jgi:predicted HTH transcriptional regulator